MRKRFSQPALALVLLVGASACSDDDDDPGVPPPVDNRFSTFVIEQFEATSDTTDAAAVNGVEFEFDEDPEVFDVLLD